MATTEYEERLLSGHTGRILAVVALGSMGSMLGRLILSPLLPVIITDLKISSGLAGLTLSGMWMMMAAAQYPGGRLSDQTSRTTVLTASLLLMAVAGAFISGAIVYVLFLVGCLLMGLGAGFYPPTANAYLTDLFKRRRGQAFGMNTAAINIGGIIASGLAVVTLGFDNWRTVYLLVLSFLLLVALLLNFWSNESLQVARIDFDLVDTSRRMVRRPQVRRIMITSAAIGFAWQGTISFLPTYLQFEKGFQPAMASNVFALLFVVGAIVTPFVGQLGDNLGHLRIAGSLVILGALGLVSLVMIPGRFPSVLSVMLFALGISSIWPVIGVFLMGRLSTVSMGGDAGATRTISLTIGAFGPSFVGIVAEFLSYRIAFTSMLVPFALAFVMLVRIARFDD